jgi:hypothetical protein
MINCISGYCSYNGPCDDINGLNFDLSLKFGNDTTHYTIPQVNFNVPGEKMFPGNASTVNTCWLGIQGAYEDTTLDTWILGTIFMHNFYIILDQDNN